MRVRLHEAAAAEFVAAAEFYERRLAGLGSEFAAEVAGTFDEIADAPERWPRVFSTDGGQLVRRRVLDRFPFAIFYLVSGPTPMILAIAHARKRPGYWRARIAK